VRRLFSGTDRPSALNRLPHSSSTAGPVTLAGTSSVAAFGVRAGDEAIRHRQATIRTHVFRLVVITISSLMVGTTGDSCRLGKRKNSAGTTIRRSEDPQMAST